MKQKSPWAQPKPVHGTGRAREKERMSPRAVLRSHKDDLQMGLIGGLLGLVLGGMVGSMAGLITAAESGSGVLGLTVAISVALLGAVVGSVTLSYGEWKDVWRGLRRNYQEARSPWVDPDLAAAFTALDERLVGLGERVDENPELVASVGRGVLESRTRLLSACQEYSRAKHGGAYSEAELGELRSVIQDEFARASELVSETSETLDEEKRLRRNPDLASQMRAALASAGLEDISAGVRARREVLTGFQG